MDKLEEIKGRLAEAAHKESVDGSMKLRELGIDSLDIVELLSHNPGQVFDKERIYERIWGYDSEGDSSVVAEHIRRIRAKTAVYTDKVYIETIWGCGYKWIK